MDQRFQLIGTGLHLPRVVVSAEEIDRRIDRPTGWTRTHVGVETRHECVAPESLGSMAQVAIDEAMAEAGIGWRDVDLVIDASASRHQPIPCNAAHLLARFGPDAEGIPGFDVQCTCLGFIIALNLANGLFAAGLYRHILIVCAEGPLGGVDWREPESAGLLGDGAAAVVIRRSEPRATCFFRQETFAQHLDICQVRGGAHNLSPFDYTPEIDAEYRFHMDGARLFRVALKHLVPLANRMIAESKLDRSRLHVVPHQASPRGVDSVRRLLDFPPERFHSRVAKMGNLVSASIPAVLHRCRRERLLEPETDVLLLGTSAGYSQAVLIFRM